METDRRIAALEGDGFMPHCGIELHTNDAGEIYAEFNIGPEHKNAHNSQFPSLRRNTPQMPANVADKRENQR